jgi:hypothetical protein
VTTTTAPTLFCLDALVLEIAISVCMIPRAQIHLSGTVSKQLSITDVREFHSSPGKPSQALMAIIDVTKELSDILTSAFGSGWGWALILAVGHFFKKSINVVLCSS